MNLYEGIRNSLKETSKYENNYRGDDYWDLSDAYVNGNLSDNELADYLLNMYERPAAVKAFKEITDGKEFPKMEVPSSDIKEISEKELHDFIMNWENDRTSVDRGRYIGKEGNKWVVIDNRTGDCWTEEFTNRGTALDYLNDKINADGSPYNEAEEKSSDIVVISNGSKYEFDSKEEAKKFWTDCCFNSEGSEQNRYLNILSQIEAGKTYVTDGSDDRVPSGKNIYKDYSDVKKKGAYKVFNGYKNPSKGDYTPKYKSYKLANEGRLSTAEGWLQFFNGHNLARSKSTWNEFKQEMLAAGREEELNKIKEELEKGYGVKLDEAEEKFKPNGVVDDIKKRGDGDLDVTSPIELNTGILPIVNVDQYSRQELFYDREDLMNDVNGDGSEILEPGDEGYYEITTEMIDDATMRYAPPVIEEYINSVLPGSSVKATKMYHPKYYNYGGDELEFTVTFDPAKYNELEEKTVADPEFKNYLKEHYSSYSGFISYLADNLDEFYQQDGWKRFVQVIMFNLRNEEDEMRSAEDSMWESIMGNIG